MVITIGKGIRYLEEIYCFRMAFRWVGVGVMPKRCQQCLAVHGRVSERDRLVGVDGVKIAVDRMPVLWPGLLGRFSIRPNDPLDRLRVECIKMTKILLKHPVNYGRPWLHCLRRWGMIRHEQRNRGYYGIWLAESPRYGAECQQMASLKANPSQVYLIGGRPRVFRKLVIRIWIHMIVACALGKLGVVPELLKHVRVVGRGRERPQDRPACKQMLTEHQ